MTRRISSESPCWVPSFMRARPGVWARVTWGAASAAPISKRSLRRIVSPRFERPLYRLGLVLCRLIRVVTGLEQEKHRYGCTEADQRQKRKDFTQIEFCRRILIR